MPTLEARIEALAAQPPASRPIDAVRGAVQELTAALNTGAVRAATPHPDGKWITHAWVKKGLLLGFQHSRLIESSLPPFSFLDKDLFPPQPWPRQRRVRVVPGGSAIREGAFVAPGVICMPPMYVNVGAFVDAGTMIDSHALVGSCAQIGKHVHLSASAQIGGVLEPPQAQPVIVEDHAFIGGGCGVYEGCLVRARAVLAPGVQLTGATRLYDLVQERVLTRTATDPLEVPAGAVVVPGTRAARGAFAAAHGLSLYAPVIVKYRDAKTDAATALEAAVRQ